jgi:hypothetical protein
MGHDNNTPDSGRLGAIAQHRPAFRVRPRAARSAPNRASSEGWRVFPIRKRIRNQTLASARPAA